MTSTSALLRLSLLLTTPVAMAGWQEVAIGVSRPAKLETRAGERVLVAKVRASEHERLDIGMEITRWLRRELARGTALSVLDVPPPELPEQRPEVMAVNDPFFRRLGSVFGADMIVAAVAELKITDRSGFVTRDVESPVTGQMIRTSQFVEQKGYLLSVEAFFLKGDNGALLHHDVWREERVVEERGAEDLQTLYELLEAMKDDLLAVVMPQKTQQPRFIWVE